MSEKERIYIAACGVCCSVCGLFVKGICLPCGSGLPADSDIVEKKMAEQRKNLGRTCSRLQCVVDKGVGYCMRDCPEFPCKMYKETTFPYSERFIGMYERRNR
ncbi:DUF3795 domain-containing protein [Candidatus Bathyarchaeota archaeon]|nr:DUF3795 domain-containing protein [Candidatus Bathyarchaeota archaeon]